MFKKIGLFHVAILFIGLYALLWVNEFKPVHVPQEAALIAGLAMTFALLASLRWLPKNLVAITLSYFVLLVSMLFLVVSLQGQPFPFVPWRAERWLFFFVDILISALAAWETRQQLSVKGRTSFFWKLGLFLAHVPFVGVVPAGIMSRTEQRG